MTKVECSPSEEIERLTRLNDRLQQQVDEQNVQLRQRRLDFHQMVESIPVPVAVTTPLGDVETLNQATLDYFGLTLDKLKAWKPSDVVHPDDLARTIAAQGSAHVAGRSYNVESRHRRADGAYRWFNVLGLPLRDSDGAIVCWFHLLIDVHDRKLAEEALDTNKLDTRLMIDGIPVGAAILDPSGEVQLVNKYMTDYFGRTEEDLSEWMKTGHAVHTSDTFSVEQRLRRHDGVYRWFEVRAFPLCAADGSVDRWCVVYADIDDRKRAEEALRANEHKLNLILNTIPTWIHILGTDGAVLYVNQAVLDYTGMTTEDTRKPDYRDRLFHADDLQRVRDVRLASLKRPVPFELEMRTHRKDGSYRWFLNRYSPLLDEHGNLDHWYATSTDIEDLKRAEKALRESENQFRDYAETASDWFWEIGPDYKFTRLTENAFAADPQSRIGSACWDHALDLDTEPDKWRRVQETLDGREPFRDFVYHAATANGSIYVKASGRAMFDAAGAFCGYRGTGTDVTEIVRAEQALAANERNLQVIIDTIPTLAWSASVDGAAEFYSKHYLDFVGLSPDEMKGWGWTSALHPDDAEKLTKDWAAIMASGKAGEAEARLRRHDGVYRTILFRANPLRNEQGEIVQWYGANTDIEDRTLAQAELQQTNELFGEALRLSRTGSFITDMDGDEHLWSDEARRIWGFGPNDDLSISSIRERIHPDDLALFDASAAESVRGGSVTHDFRITDAGDIRHVRVAAHATKRNGHRSFIGALQDLTDQKLIEAELRRNAGFLSKAQELSLTGSFSWSSARPKDFVFSAQLYRTFEFPSDTPITAAALEERYHPDDRQFLRDALESARTGEIIDYEHRLLFPDGRIKHVHVFATVDPNSADGTMEYFGAVQDVTQRRLADQALETVRAELAHAARAMSLGVLTASIAHEVNQPLSGIVTNANTCLRMLAADPPNIDGARQTAQRTIRDGNRASEVISRLRTLFAKKDFAAEAVDLNAAAREVIALSMQDLQRRGATLDINFAEDLPHISGDHIQVQQVILNLLLNASDAIEQTDRRARRISIETRRDGDHAVALSIRDTGVGLPKDADAKLFDAFFTTKPNGMGIGLSVSRSIIERHHGRLWATPNEGAGATFTFSVPSIACSEPPPMLAADRERIPS